MDGKPLDALERFREKAASRAEDARLLAAGEKDVGALRRENEIFALLKFKLGSPADER